MHNGAAQMIFHVWRTNATLLQKMAQEVVRRALTTGAPPRNLAGLKLVLHSALPASGLDVDPEATVSQSGHLAIGHQQMLPAESSVPDTCTATTEAVIVAAAVQCVCQAGASCRRVSCNGVSL